MADWSHKMADISQFITFYIINFTILMMATIFKGTPVLCFSQQLVLEVRILYEFSLNIFVLP